MAQLTAKQRQNMAPEKFALSGERFPINDANHARAALSGAPRALHAGNISKEEADKVIGKANSFLDAHENRASHADGVPSK